MITTHKVTCPDCDGTGETDPEHAANCDLDDCERCAENVFCETCRGYEVIDCNGDCPQCSGETDEQEAA